MRTRNSMCRPVHRRDGTAATELALTLPLLLLLSFGCADLGRAIAASIALSNATRAGADYAATHGFTDHTEQTWIAAIEQQVRNEMSNTAGISSDGISVSVSSEPLDDSLYRVTVTSTYSYSTISLWPGLPTQIPLRHSVTMQRFR